MLRGQQMLSEQNYLHSLFLCQRFIMQLQQKGAVYHTTDVLHAAAEKKRRPKLQEKHTLHLPNVYPPPTVNAQSVHLS